MLGTTNGPPDQDTVVLVSETLPCVGVAASALPRVSPQDRPPTTSPPTAPRRTSLLLTNRRADSICRLLSPCCPVPGAWQQQRDTCPEVTRRNPDQAVRMSPMSLGDLTDLGPLV